MMGGEHVLSRSKSKTLFSETFEVLQIHLKDSGKRRRMVRPTEFIDDNHLRLYISKSGYIVGMAANKCYVAYDFKSKHSFGDSNIGELSPFVLINSNTLMNQDDVRDVISDMKETCLAGKKVYYPSSRYIGRPMLENSLIHPNVGVRKLAKQLLDILIEHEK